MLSSRIKNSAHLLVWVVVGSKGVGDTTGSRRALVALHQVTWGSINTVIGVVAGLVCTLLLGAWVQRWKTVTLVRLPAKHAQAATLGPVVVVLGELPADVLDHEMGHWYQSVALGPLYFLVIGLPSVLHAIWFGKKARPQHHYYRFYTEAWADAWGGVWHLHQHPVRRWWHYLWRSKSAL